MTNECMKNEGHVLNFFLQKLSKFMEFGVKNKFFVRLSHDLHIYFNKLCNIVLYRPVSKILGSIKFLRIFSLNTNTV